VVIAAVVALEEFRVSVRDGEDDRDFVAEEDFLTGAFDAYFEIEWTIH